MKGNNFQFYFRAKSSKFKSWVVSAEHSGRQCMGNNIIQNKHLWFLSKVGKLRNLGFFKSVVPTSLAPFPLKNNHGKLTTSLLLFRRTTSLVLIDADWMTPSAVGSTSVTRAILLSWRRIESSIKHTSSPIFRKRSSPLVQIGRIFHLGRNSSRICSKSLDCLSSHFIQLSTVMVSDRFWHQGLCYDRSSLQKLIGLQGCF